MWTDYLSGKHNSSLFSLHQVIFALNLFECSYSIQEFLLSVYNKHSLFNDHFVLSNFMFDTIYFVGDKFY